MHIYVTNVNFYRKIVCIKIVFFCNTVQIDMKRKRTYIHFYA